MELDFEKNLGDTDRIIRVIIGFALLGLAQYTSEGWAVLAYALGIFQFIEAFFAY